MLNSQPYKPPLLRCAVLLSALLLTACSTTQPQQAQHQAQNVHFAQVLTTPLRDLNLIRTKIPDTLVAAAHAPYALPSNTSCAELALNIKALNFELGDDLDVPDESFDLNAPELNKTITPNRVGEALVREVGNELGRTINGLVPYRRWIRLLSGANLHSKRLSAAVYAGSLRRAYLKGMHAIQHCPALPAPIKAVQPISVPTTPESAPTDNIYF